MSVADKKKLALLAPQSTIEQLLTPYDLKELNQLCHVVCWNIPDNNNEDVVYNALRKAEIILSGWGMPQLTPERLALASHLKIIIYGASSVKYFMTQEVFDKGITVTSAAAANGTTVAEFTLAMMTLSLKGCWPMIRRDVNVVDYFTRSSPWQDRGGLYGATIGIIGASSVGREVIRLLNGYHCSVLLSDPMVDQTEARRLNCTRVDMDSLMQQSDIVSLHAPNIPKLRHMIGEHELSLMKEGAWFINTARGALVDETALIAALSSGRINACIDVTDPEPPAHDNPLLRLPNVIVTPHIAGAIGADVRRMGKLCMQELRCYLDNRDPLYPVRAERLPVIN